MQDLAVFTGDIVRSTDMEHATLTQMFVALEAQCATIGGWPASTTSFQRYRGDGWQMALPPQYALRAAAVMRAAARATGKGHDTRIGIGIGQGHIQNGDLGAADGPAFVDAGRALDRIKRGPLMSAPDTTDLLRISLPLVDRIVQGWTSKQAQIAAALLAPSPPTQDALATQLGHSRQLMQKQSDAAGLTALVDSFDVFEQSHNR
jgi:hypothetical protein